jgi:LysM repeat protein
MKQYRVLVIVIVALAIVAGSLGFSTRSAYAASCTQYYYVRRGQSLSSIASWYGVKWQYLAQINGIRPPYTIYTGQKLCVSTKGSGYVYTGYYYPASYTASWKNWSFHVIGVVEDTTVTIKTANFPDNMLYHANVGCASCGTSATYVGDVDSGAGGTFKQVLTIPAAFAGVNNLWVSLEQANKGITRKAPFTNSTVYSSGGKYYYYPYYPYYGDIPTISIVSVVRNSTVTIQTHNFPANYTFKVLMGPMGSKGVNGYNMGSFSSGNGSSQTLTFDIPSQLYGNRQIAIRTQSTSGGYFSYNWFYNNTAY